MIVVAVVVCFLAGSLPAQSSGGTNGNPNGKNPATGTYSASNPGVCDGSGIGRQTGQGNGKGYGVRDGSGNGGNRPQDGTGYGAKNQHPLGSMGTNGSFSRGQGAGRQGGGFGNRRNNR
jgi:hypothetical protein